MTDDLSALDNLRPEVRCVLPTLDSMACSADEEAVVKTIRAELLRLARENAEFHRKDADARIARNCEHELKKWRK